MVIEQEQVRKLLSGIVKTKPNIRATDHKWLIAMLSGNKTKEKLEKGESLFERNTKNQKGYFERRLKH